MFKKILISLVTLMVANIAVAQDLDHLTKENQMEPFGNMKKASYVGNVLYGGQPDEATIQMLKEKGFNMIISVKFDDEKVPFDEKNVVEENGMSFARIPYFKGSINDEVRTVDDSNMAELSKLLSDVTKSGQKVYMHCQSGQRAAAALGSILARDYGYSKEQAMDIAAKAGLTSKNTGAAFERYLDQLK